MGQKQQVIRSVCLKSGFYVSGTIILQLFWCCGTEQPIRHMVYITVTKERIKLEPYLGMMLILFSDIKSRVTICLLE